MLEQKKNINTTESKQLRSELAEEIKPWWAEYRWWLIAGMVILVLLTGLSLAAVMTGDKDQKRQDEINNELEQAGETAGMMYLWPDEAKVKTGEEFTVDIIMNTNGYNIAAAAAVLEYDPNSIEIVRVDGANSAMSIAAEATIGENQVTIVRGQPADSNPRDSDDGFTGERGLFSSVVARAKQSGETAINFNEEKSKMIIDDGKGTGMEMMFHGGEYAIK